MKYQRFTLGPKLEAHDWPLQMARGAMGQGLSPGKDFVLTSSALYSYFFRDPASRIEYAITEDNLVKRDGMKARPSDASDALDAMIVATYREGVELYRVLGRTFTDVKLDGLDTKTAELQSRFKKFGDNNPTQELKDHYRVMLERERGRYGELPKGYSADEEHLVGCLHVMEMMQTIRAQAFMALLADEGLISTEEYQKKIDASHNYLAARGHLGPYKLAKAQPQIDAFLKNDKRIISVQFMKDSGKYAGLNSPLNHPTRAAYFNSEAGDDGFLKSASWIKPEEHEKYLSENTYPQAMGEWYITAFQEKAEAAAKATQGHVRADHKMKLQSLSEQPLYRSTDSLEYDRFKRSGQDYAAKHGIALMHPEVVVMLEEAGKFTGINSASLDLAFHHGYHPPYLEHISDLARRMNSPGYSPVQPPKSPDRIAPSVPNSAIDDEKADNLTLPAPPPSADADGQKKTPGQTEPLEETTPTRQRDTDSGGRSSSPSHSSFSTGRTSGSSTAGDKSDSAEKQGWVTAGKVGTALLGSVLVADQYRRAHKKDEASDGKSEKKSKVINYVLGAAAAAGVAVVVFTKPEKLVKFVDDLSKFFGKGTGKA